MIPGAVMLIAEEPVDRVVELARLAESLGFSRVWVPDEGLATRDVFVTMAAIAMATRTISIGTGIVNPYSRHPAMVASAIATIDEVSGGRAFLGYGAGGSLTLGPLGIDRSRPLAHVRDAITACRELFSGRVVELGGTVPLHGASIDYGRSDIEIWFAGRGPRMLTQAGALADGVLLEFLHKPSLGYYVERVREGARGARRSPKLCYSTTVVTDPARLDQIRPHMTYRLVDSPPEVREAVGISDTDRERIREAMAGGLAAAAPLIPDEWIEPFVIMGTPQECAAELAEITERHGMDEFMVAVADMSDADVLMTQVAEVLAAT